MTQSYVDKEVREAFEAWVDPGYVQHNPMAATGREAAINFLEPFFATHPDIH
jgi:predicted SnoaL-like aldol condensation-catalyzing enzyme